jgi:hypothetical protein
MPDMYGNPSGRVALAALFLSLGAKPWEIQPAVDLLSGKAFPPDYLTLCQDAHDALVLHRTPRHTQDTASGPRTMLAKLCGCAGPTDPGHIKGCPHARTRGTDPA